jgi:hypothetical protein
MALAKKLSCVTTEEYLEGEKVSDVKNDYIDGEIYQ